MLFWLIIAVYCQNRTKYVSMAGLPDSLSGAQTEETHETYQSSLCPGRDSDKLPSSTVKRYVKLDKADIFWLVIKANCSFVCNVSRYRRYLTEYENK